MKLQETTAFKTTYAIEAPYVYIAVAEEEATHETRYKVIEPTIEPGEVSTLENIKKILIDEMNIPIADISATTTGQLIEKEVARIIKDYRLKVDTGEMNKILYYVKRDFLGYERIDPMMRDHLIEDISCDGVGVPIYVWHREYESIPTNVVFKTTEELNRFVVRLAYKCGKHISFAAPILDGSLPDGSRANATFGSEISTKGTTFTIRRFKADPLTVVDLMELGTLSPDLAAFLWYAVENRCSILVAGGVASGKTTLLNGILMFIRPDLKIVTIEETPEINIPHANWAAMTTRMGFGSKGSEISLFDLLKNSLRQRPDYIIVGEVRGSEAYTLFQALATGHGVCATVHADSPSSIIKRLESKPMNVPRPLIGLVDLMLIQNRIRVGNKSMRRTMDITEVKGYDSETDQLVIRQKVRWDPATDTFEISEKSFLLQKIAEKNGISLEAATKELAKRKIILKWLQKKGMRRYQELGNLLREYYTDPEGVYRRAMVESL
jgi:flagellar protein FlaI